MMPNLIMLIFIAHPARLADFATTWKNAVSEHLKFQFMNTKGRLYIIKPLIASELQKTVDYSDYNDLNHDE